MPRKRALQFVVGICLAMSTTLAIAQSTREIVYRGGILRFAVPADWAEEYEQQGGATFYAKRPNSGSLRLNVVTLKAPNAVTAGTAQEVLKQLRGIDRDSIEQLPSGNAIGRDMQRLSDSGIAITQYWWYLSNPVPPEYVRIAMFSYTVPTSNEKSAQTSAELKLLERSIRNAKFHPTLGE